MNPIERKLPIAKPCLGKEEAAAASEVILSGWVTQGPKIKEFEDSFAKYTGAQYACAVSNCTTALHLALKVVGVKPGDIVLTVSHSFIATANSIRHCGAEPYFVDIDLSSLNMCEKRLQNVLETQFEHSANGLRLKDSDFHLSNESPLNSFSNGLSGNLKAILVVHQIGMPANLSKILEIARHYQLPVVEDAACAIGSEISMDSGKTWNKIGRCHGDVTCFSFHPRKVITTGDGGMITTNQEAYDRQFRLLRQHGMSVPDLARHHSKEVIFESYETTGYNYRMTDIQAAVGIEQLKRLPEIVQERRKLAQSYFSQLEGIPGVSFQTEGPFAKSNWQSFYIQLDRKHDLKRVMQVLHDFGVTTRRGIMCSHREPPYSASWKDLPNPLTQSEHAQDRGLLLPLFPGMTEDDLNYVVAKLRIALEG